jgi:hypothetical protein
VTVFSTRLPDNVKGAAKFMYAIAAEKEEIKPPIPA